jgi:GDPmannose 4,6-dehydratase
MRVLVTGVTGMDGSHLAEQLLADGHEVYGLVRGQRTPSCVPDGLNVLRGDLGDQTSLIAALRTAQPHAVYNLAAITAIGLSWGQPALMADTNGLGVLRLLEAIRFVDDQIRFVQASTADQFGNVPPGVRMSETTPFAPRSPYGVAKQTAHDTVVTYRQAYGLHASTLIMFNHSSERHGPEFVVRKVTQAAARIALGLQEKLAMGDLTGQRDWGYAPDYVRAYPLAAAQKTPGDYVIASGTTHSVEQLVATAFDSVGLDWRQHVTTDPNFSRPIDVAVRQGDPTHAEEVLGWNSTVGFGEMIARMVREDLDSLNRDPYSDGPAMGQRWGYGQNRGHA